MRHPSFTSESVVNTPMLKEMISMIIFEYSRMYKLGLDRADEDNIAHRIMAKLRTEEERRVLAIAEEKRWAEERAKLLQEKSCGLCNGPMPECGCPGEWLDMLNVGADIYVNSILEESEITTADMYNDTSPESIRLKKAFAEWSLATFVSSNEEEK